MTTFTSPHRRYNPLTDEWILVSPQRATRPWQGAVERVPQERRPEYDPKCYLCPGNTRVNGVINPTYAGVYVFDNDFPALLTQRQEVQATHSEQPSQASASHLLRSEQETGVCRVICFSPRHDLTLAQMPAESIRPVVDTWVAQCEELGARDDITYVQLFENRGEAMGSSNPHPHGQLWATRHVPTEVMKETRGQARYLGEDRDTIETPVLGSPSRSSRSPLLIDYLDLELRDGVRLIFENAHFACLVPFWAIWPFEVMLLPKRHVRRIVELTSSERDALADALRCITVRYDNLFEVSFPYTMGVHQAPYDGEAHDEWQLHLHFYPPLLRSATVKKFMVGYEMLAQPQRDLTAEQAAERLRSLSETRFA